MALGRGGIALVHRGTGTVPSTVGKGINELRRRSEDEGPAEGKRRVRRPGGGRRRKIEEDPQLLVALEALIRIPVVEGYTYDLKGSGIRCDIEALDGFTVNEEPAKVYLTEVRGYNDTPGGIGDGTYIEQDRVEFYRTVRPQQVKFRLAHLVMERLIQGAQGEGADRLRRVLHARHQLFPELLRIIDQFISRKVRFAPGVDQREPALRKYSELLCQQLLAQIHAVAASGEVPLLPVVNSFKPWVSTAEVNYRTTRPVVALTKSHLNNGAHHLDWERQTMDILEDFDFVECYTPNDRNIGLMIPYEYGDSPHHYEPDFVVRLRGGRQVVLEIKGRAGEMHDENKVEAKNAAARKWCAAVSNAGRFGSWVFEICRDLDLLRASLLKHAADGERLPFRVVESPKAAERYRTCVPLVSLRAAAGRWSEEQGSIEEIGEWAQEWVLLDEAPRLERGMFVARVQGRSMEPRIPDGSYCLFRSPGGGTRQGRILLVWHSGVADPANGGHYTVKVYSSEKASNADSDWVHTRIVLKPLNPEFEPIELVPEDESEVRVLAEFVAVIGTTIKGA